MYYRRAISSEKLTQQFKAIHTFLFNKWFWDEIYDIIVIKPTLWLAGILAVFDKLVIDGLVNFTGKSTLVFSWVSNLFDRYIVDGAVNGIGYTTRAFGLAFSRFQTGRVFNYAFVIVLGVVVILIIKLF
jgi:NADH-quinone oxidoreductase subunit L